MGSSGDGLPPTGLGLRYKSSYSAMFPSHPERGTHTRTLTHTQKHHYYYGVLLLLLYHYYGVPANPPTGTSKACPPTTPPLSSQDAFLAISLSGPPPTISTSLLFFPSSCSSRLNVRRSLLPLIIKRVCGSFAGDLIINVNTLFLFLSSNLLCSVISSFLFFFYFISPGYFLSNKPIYIHHPHLCQTSHRYPAPLR